MSKEYLNRTIEFHKNYEKDVLPILLSFEDYRIQEWKEVSKRINLMKFMWIIVFFIVFIMIAGVNEKYLSESFKAFIDWLTFDGFIYGMIFVTLYPFIFILVMIRSNKYISETKNNYSKVLKISCLQKLLSVFGNITWKLGSNEYNTDYIIEDNLISNAKLECSGLFADFSERKIDDEFEGIHKGVEFKISETSLVKQRYSGGKRYYVNVFNGVIISFKSNKKISNRTMVATKGDLTQKNSWLLNYALLFVGTIQIILDSLTNNQTIQPTTLIMCFIYVIIGLLLLIPKHEKEPLNEMKLEDPNFAKRFNAYSSDQVAGRYLLTTAFMQRFQNLKTAFGSKNAKCSFFGDEIMFAIETKKNLFEIGTLDRSLKDPISINEFYNELSSILNMIEYFKLDEKTAL